jgi:hypothetical protein
MGQMELDRRSSLVATSPTATITGCGAGLDNGSPAIARADPPDPSQTFVLRFVAIVFPLGNLPARSGEMAGSATKASGAQSFVITVEREEGDSGRGAGDDLRDQIHPQRRPGERAHHHRADRDRRVERATGDRADRESAC